MNLIEIKKALYKEKPIAKRCLVGDMNTTYTTKLSNNEVIGFCIPSSEITDSFTDEMNAQLLIRWIIN